MKNRIGIGLVFLASASTAQAHDYWMQPKRFVVSAGMPLSVRLLVGDKFVSDIERPFQAKPTLRFQLVSKKTTRDLTKVSKDGKKPLLRLDAVPPGTHWLVMERDVQHITLKPEKFTRYLQHENLNAILKARRKTGEDKKPGRERYSRYLKCLIQAGKTRDDTWKRVLKLRLEIVPLTNPAELKPGDTLKVRVLFDGKPLAGTAVFCHHRAGKKVRTQATNTDKTGMAAITVRGKGTYLVRLVHMRRCNGCPKSDWESFWAAMTFGVP